MALGTPDESEMHLITLGGIVTQLHFIEYSIRYYLFSRNPQKALPFLETWPSLKEGDSVPENELTNYDHLRTLIDKYNARAPAHLKVDPNIVKIRDALAHGRATTEGSFPMRLIKFSKAVNGAVNVEYCQKLDSQWLREHLGLLEIQSRRIAEAITGWEHEQAATASEAAD